MYRQWMKRKAPILLSLAVLLIIGLAACRGGEKKEETTPADAAAVDSAEGESSDKSEEDRTAALPDTEGKDKEEKVYVKADATGKPEEVTVETLLRNRGRAEGRLEDVSELTEIRNTQGDEEFRLGDGNVIFWEDHGQNIHYKGTGSKDLPLQIHISYELDGTPISPEKLAGQSGHIKIRFAYENQTETTVTVEGKQISTQVPFMAISSLLLPEETSRNIEVTNGKVLELEGRKMIIGYAFPGLSENLKLSQYEPTKEVEIPEYVEISADVEEFELDFTATIISNGLFEDMDEEKLKDADDVTEAMEKLSDGSKKLSQGAEKLLDGMDVYQGHLDTYMQGVAKAAEGAAAMQRAMKMLNDQKGTLQTGSEKLCGGLQTLDSSLKKMNLKSQSSDTSDLTAAVTAAQNLGKDLQRLQSGMETAASAIAAAQKLAAEASAYVQQVQTCREAAGAKLAAVDLASAETDGARIAKDQAIAAAEAAIDGSGISEEEKEQVKAEVREQIERSIDISGITATAGEQIEQVKEQLDGIPEFSITPISPDFSDIEASLEDMQKQLQILADFGKEMSGFSESISGISSQLQELQTAISALAQGSTQLNTGITAFNQGIEKIYQGSESLGSGASTLQTAGDALKEGFAALRDGSSELKKGVVTFDQEGISELKKLAGSELTDVITGLKAAREADRQYINFGGIKDGQTGSTSFIIETEKITKT